MSANISTTVYNWLREIKIPVSKSYLNQLLNSHPDFPSLLSITDTLTELGIENSAIQIEKEQLSDLPRPFIAHLKGNGGEFVMIKDLNDLDQQFPGFYNRWGGVVMAAEKPLNWEHQLNTEWLNKDLRKKQSLFLSISVIAFLTLLTISFSFNWTSTVLLLIAAIGIFISWMIVTKDLGIENKIADKVCGANADCDSVIHSGTIKLPFNIVWSDTGLIYFSFLLIITSISSLSSAASGFYPLLSLLSVAAIPITLVSVYYQWKVIKKWCRLCLVTVGLLWLQFIALLPQTLNLPEVGFDNTVLSSSLLIVLMLFIIATAWLWLKPLIKENKELKTENFNRKRFSRNADIFNALLEKQKRVEKIPAGLGITIGNPAAENTIIKVCNPYCGPCSKAHPVIEKLVEENSNVKVQILFTASDDEKDNRAKVVRHLMALYEKKEKPIQKALDDWYLADKKDYDVFAGKYIMNGELEKQGEKLNAMKKWCDEVKIEFTPTFFVNGFQLPKQYGIDEVKYFLEKS